MSGSSQEMDPIVGKGVKLLLSNDEESSEELRSYLEEQIRGRFGVRRAQGVAGLSPSSEGNSPSSSSSGRRRPGTAGSDETAPPRKLARAGDGGKSSSESPTFDTGSSGGDSEDLGLEILEENLCYVCRGIQTSARNRFVECTDCHNLYHQNCASPAVEADVTDPRFVWYCETCKKQGTGTTKVVVTSTSSSQASTSSSLGSTSSPGSTVKSAVLLSQKITTDRSKDKSSTTSSSQSSSGSAPSPGSTTSATLLSQKIVGSPGTSSGSTGSSPAVSTGGGGSSSSSVKTTAGSSASAKTSGSGRSGSQTTYTVMNKPFGNKFKLFKTVNKR